MRKHHTQQRIGLSGPGISTMALLSLAGFAAITARPAELPAPGSFDARVRYVQYRKDDVTVVNVRRGVVTRIVLEDGERILAAATGFSADCTKDASEWCISADTGSNEIWVKPRDGATYNNLELKTNKRDYSFEFRLLSDVRGAPSEANLTAEPMFRVIFRYDAPSAGGLAALLTPPSPPKPTSAEIVAERINTERPSLRNTRYSMQVLKGSDGIAPSLVFDDGRFTYFRFANNREVPTIFAISERGEESRVNFNMEGDLVVVQRLDRRFVLRLGREVVGVWNESFDPDGVPPVAGTTVPGVERTIRVAAPTDTGATP